MGQRVCILLKKNFGNNKSTITLIHHQWGIGKTMPAYLMEEALKYVYPLDRSLSYLQRSKLEGEKKLPIDYFFTFEPLNNPQNNYITNRVVPTDDPNEDIWKPEVRIRYGNQTDNNNGMMLVEVTQNFDRNGEPENCHNMLTVKVGFTLGYEETRLYHRKLKDTINLEPNFSRLVSGKEFALRTFGHNPNAVKFIKKFMQAYKTVLELADIEEVFDKKGEKKRNEKEAHILNCIEALTKDLPEGTRIDVPMEFKEKELLYT